MRFKNKVVLITGASRGIGKATALAFAKEGANVIVDYFISDIEPDADSNAKKVVKEIQEIGTKAMAIEADVSNEEHVKELVEKVVSAFDAIDILINNAGIVFDVPFKQRTVNQWEKTLAVNLIGMFICSKHCSGIMEQKNGGVIVNVTSTNGINNFFPDSIDYDSSKAGAIMLTRNLAKELAKYNIRVNSVAPGWVNTDMNKDLSEELVKEETEKIYLKRFAEPEEIANVILFLASNEAGYITGETVKVDGGYG